MTPKTPRGATHEYTEITEAMIEAGVSFVYGLDHNFGESADRRCDLDTLRADLKALYIEALSANTVAPARVEHVVDHNGVVSDVDVPDTDYCGIVVMDDDAELVERLMREFYLSIDYDPKAKRPADTVKAAIAFTLERLASKPDGLTRELVEALNGMCLALCQLPEEATGSLGKAAYEKASVVLAKARAALLPQAKGDADA